MNGFSLILELAKFIKSLLNNDFEKTYYEYLQGCMECGISLDQFLTLDDKEIEISVKAYQHKLHNESYIQGMYFYQAIMSGLSHLGNKKGIDYPKEPLIYEYERKQVTKTMTTQDKDLLFRQTMNEWL